jgi:hypothetical protein
METTRFTVPDNNRSLTFDGVMLANVSSKRVGVWRWTELRLYLTDTQTYVLERVGASRVTHLPACRETVPNLPRFQEVYPGADPDSNEFDYHSCVTQFYDFPSLLVERDRHWAQIATKPEAVIKAVSRYRAGAQWMPRTSADLLAMAAEVDEGIAAAYNNVWVR